MSSAVLRRTEEVGYEIFHYCNQKYVARDTVLGKYMYNEECAVR